MCLSICSHARLDVAARLPEGDRGGSHLCYPGTQVATHKVLVALQFGLNNDQGEIGLRVHVAGHLLNLLDLCLDALVNALKEAIGWPPWGKRKLDDI